MIGSMPSLRERTLGLGLLTCGILIAQAGDAVGGVGTPVPHCLLVAQAASSAAGSVTYTPMRRPGAPSPAVAAQPSPLLPKAPASPAPLAPTYAPAPAPPVPVPPTYAAPPPVVPAPAAPTPFAPEVGAPSANAEPVGTVAAKSIRPAKPGHRFLGVVSDAGMPDGLNLGLVLAPADWMRFVAAIGSNSASLGYRGGLSLVPMGWGPSFTVEVGHCNTAPTTSLLRTFFTVPSWMQQYVQQLGYTYVNAHVGFDYRLGGFTLFVHGGVTYLSGTLRSPASVVVDSKTNTSIKIPEDGAVTAYTLSAKAGLLYMFGGL